jgi:cellulose biosynthesis protein BcsQ
MAVYALWNNKGGVGKSYLTFQIACQYARTHPDQKVLVIDLCPQANSSGMLLGGMIRGEAALNELSSADPRHLESLPQSRQRCQLPASGSFTKRPRPRQPFLSYGRRGA